MTPEICLVKHNPPDTYGDCVRACVASVLEMPAADVPHFYSDGDGEAAFDRMRVWLADRGRIPAYFPLHHETLDGVLWAMKMYPDVEYLLFCSNGAGDHCVIGRNDEIIHDPAWYKTQIVGPHSSGVWIVIILASCK